MLRIRMKIPWLFACFVSIHAYKWKTIEYDFDSTAELDSSSGGSAELQINVSEDPYTVEMHTSFDSTCYLHNDRGEVWWTRDNRNITFYDFFNRPIENRRILKIESVSRNDTGNYTCVASTAGGRLLEKTITIRVIEPGAIVALQQQVRVENNKPAILSCLVQGDPLSNFTWQYERNPNRFGVLEKNDFENATQILPTNHSSVIMTLHFENVTVSQHGYYWCIARDYKGPIFRWIYLGSIDETSVIIHQYEPSINWIEIVGANSVYVNWAINWQSEKTSDNCYIQLQYKKNNTEQWINHTTTISSNRERRLVKGLENSTAYLFRILSTDYFGNSLVPKDWKWATTMKKNFDLVPTVRIEATTLDSITIRASMPTQEQYYDGYYKGVLTHENETIGPQRWPLYVEYFILDNPELFVGLWVFENPKPTTRYHVKVTACPFLNIPCGGWSAEQEIITIDRDPIFVPNISVKETTSASITIGWRGPGPELQDRVHQYKVIATKDDETIGPVYLNKTADSYVFENLTSAKSYKLKVAACSDFETQCGNWSTEEEGFTRDSVRKGHVTIWLSAVAIVLIFVVVVVIWLVIRDRRNKAARKRFIVETLERFNLGALDCLNPELNIGDQAELLPYNNKKWEFPRGLLKLDKVLGSGAFGVVRKAQAKSICQREKITTVAVKLVRASARLHEMTALTRELKILAYLGKHLNVVNLLGACTQNVSYGELLVIVEFCRFGNLRDYLLHRRDDFVDQVNITDTVEDIDSSSSSSVDSATPDDNGVVTPGCGEDSSSTENSLQPTDFGNTSITLDNDAAGSDSVEPDPPSKYQGDYTDDNLEPICTRDLLCWSWQISRGMKYLGSRRILHGDLAARNILLADRNVVKICDFGLAKALYMDDNYTKKGHGPLPVKWMAIESLRDRVFSVQSDIWSYGIVLWELFSLSETPYPGIDNGNVYRKLADGFRLNKPKYATQDIYCYTMLRCWDAEPNKRPSFAELENIFADLLDERVKTHYLDLSAPYARMNADDLQLKERDYLTMGPSADTTNATQ